MITIFFTETKLLVLNVLFRKQKFEQNYFLVMIAPELSQRKYKRQAKSWQEPTSPPYRQDILPSAFTLTVYIQFSLIISFLVINSRAMGSTSTNHSEVHIGINSVKD
jgi:hypothetical protein